ncbi:hypothetical protein PR048_033477 [Dryococelus australis]|uniref:Uncharacterized protein n=1 Tax=Dryococelus australis TaxID=614101 RepID=A0ABQ9G1B0_9NEOP|nr:hypothetical protein PR048_033477 [Dryococelus australis]
MVPANGESQNANARRTSKVDEMLCTVGCRQIHIAFRDCKLENVVLNEQLLSVEFQRYSKRSALTGVRLDYSIYTFIDSSVIGIACDQCFQDVTYIRNTISEQGGGGIALVVRLLASHLGEPGSIPRAYATRFSHVGIKPDDAAGRRVFWGCPISPAVSFRCCSPYSPPFTLIGSQYLDVKSHPNLLTHATYFGNTARRFRPMHVAAMAHLKHAAKSPSSVPRFQPLNAERNLQSRAEQTAEHVLTYAARDTVLISSQADRLSPEAILSNLVEDGGGRGHSFPPVILDLWNFCNTLEMSCFLERHSTEELSKSQTSLLLFASTVARLLSLGTQPLIQSSTQLPARRPAAIFIVLTVTISNVQRTPSHAERTSRALREIWAALNNEVLGADMDKMRRLVTVTLNCYYWLKGSFTSCHKYSQPFRDVSSTHNTLERSLLQENNANFANYFVYIVANFTGRMPDIVPVDYKSARITDEQPIAMPIPASEMAGIQLDGSTTTTEVARFQCLSNHCSKLELIIFCCIYAASTQYYQSNITSIVASLIRSRRHSNRYANALTSAKCLCKHPGIRGQRRARLPMNNSSIFFTNVRSAVESLAKTGGTSLCSTGDNSRYVAVNSYAYVLLPADKRVRPVRQPTATLLLLGRRKILVGVGAVLSDCRVIVNPALVRCARRQTDRFSREGPMSGKHCLRAAGDSSAAAAVPRSDTSWLFSLACRDGHVSLYSYASEKDLTDAIKQNKPKKLLASHHGEPVEAVPDNATGSAGSSPTSPRFTLIGSQDPAVKSHLTLSTQLFTRRSSSESTIRPHL